MHWLEHLLGLDDPSGRWYLWWSGPFADIPILAAVVVFLWHRNCHVKGCRRLGRFPLEGSSWTVCGRHHPTGAPSANDVKGAGP